MPVAGQARLVVGKILITAIVQSAASILLIIENSSNNGYSFSFREPNSDIDAESASVAAHHIVQLVTGGAILPDELIKVGIFRGW
ncbi:hypothetical protein BGZ57DRAFT_895357 [Hyaloscypha finlandica]|nr:hypothetical protein BGZ57DRAFT_895357 [Hyaloscypha finlandica]KAH8790839.1 hypothetical protein F5882DRAFT_400989 [Hyaloscypha sp. PMI_1271]